MEKREKQRLACLLWRRRHPEAAKAALRRYAERHPEKRRAAAKAFRAKNPGYHTLLRDRKQELVAGRPRPSFCECCGEPPQPKDRGLKLHFDHDHATGAFRGWICHRCNTTLGKVRDDPEVLGKLIDYLAQPRHLKLVQK